MAKQFVAQVIIDYGPFKSEEDAKKWAAKMEEKAAELSFPSRTMNTEVHIWESG